MRTPALKNVPTNVFLSSKEVEPGKLGCRLWAPNRPPLAQNFPAFSGSGAVPTITGLVSARMSTSQTSLGASAHLSLTASSETSAKPRPKSGCTVWVHAGNGGENVRWLTSLGEKLLALPARTDDNPEISRMI